MVASDATLIRTETRGTETDTSKRSVSPTVPYSVVLSMFRLTLFAV